MNAVLLSRILTWSLVLILGTTSTSVAQTPRELAVTPTAPADPVLKPRLLPLSSERTPGDAAPVYLRLSLEYHATYPEMQKRVAELLEMPNDTFPVEEARTFVNTHGARLEMLDIAARRADCDWSYPLYEQRDRVIEILLPDVQDLRTWARMVALKARVEIAEGKLDDARRTLETGLSMSRDVANGPFLINSLVGIAIAASMLEQVEALIQRPDAPNLYWALTALPRPFIDTRNALENEQKVAEWMVPELTKLDEPRSAAEWSVLFDKMYASLGRLGETLSSYAESPGVSAFKDTTAEAMMETLLPQARKAYPQDGLSDDERLARFLAGQYAAFRDEIYATCYLDYPEVVATTANRAEAIERAQKANPVLALLAEVTPSVEKSIAAETRLDRQIAALRAVEAIRWQAAENGGAPPESLKAVQVAPVPSDPATGQPFEYKVDGQAITLSAPALGDDLKAVSYRLSLRE